MTTGSATVRRLEYAPAPLYGRLDLPGSKSLTNRALLLAALASRTSRLTGVLRSGDTEAMVGALRALGFQIEADWERRSLIVSGAGGRIPAGRAEVFCGEAGTVARFLLAACATGHGTYRFDGLPSLRRRPMGPLTATLERMGAAFEPASPDRLPFTLRARGAGGGLQQVEGSASSQFFSGLLMAAPLAAAPVELEWRDPTSRPYVAMTVSMMGDYGVTVERPAADRYRVGAPAGYQARDLAIEADASTASYFFAAAAVTGGRVTVGNLSSAGSRQGDAGFLTVLDALGCDVRSDATSTTVVGPHRLRGVSLDMSDTPDVFMTLACLAPYADQPVEIRGVAQARYHESDRIATTAVNLRTLGVRVAELPDGLRVEPGQPHAGRITAHGDHRIAMSFAVLALRTPGIELVGAESVEKTCPEFFQLWADLLGRDR